MSGILSFNAEKGFALSCIFICVSSLFKFEPKEKIHRDISTKAKKTVRKCNIVFLVSSD
jgi:hypothetical protein